MNNIHPGALVAFRNEPARVIRTGDRWEIELSNGEVFRVRPKDVVLIHPGPIQDLKELHPVAGDLQGAWQILAGMTTTLVELSELAFGTYTPQTAWEVWKSVLQGYLFKGTPEAIQVLSEEEVREKEEQERAKQKSEQEWQAFLNRIRLKQWIEQDIRYLKEVEQFAYGISKRSRVLQELKRAETPENAHQLLLEIGYWKDTHNPHPRRLQVPLQVPIYTLPSLPDEPRIDLTHLSAYAIDDEGSEVPDDAVSLEGRRIWVHIADPAALIFPDTPPDLEARQRVESLHLPEGTIHMLSEDAISKFGLGKQEISPALSIGIELSTSGEIQSVDIVPSWVRVTRLTYQIAETLMNSSIFAEIEDILSQHRTSRQNRGAVDLDLPEVKIKVDSSYRVSISPVLSLRSRRMVEEAMILAGSALAQWCSARHIPVPFSVQEPPEQRLTGNTLADMYAMRRWMRRNQYRISPGEHAGLGLSAYVPGTSPLRRYLDLVVHQQIRRSLREERVLSEQEILERIGEVEALLPSLRQAETLSEKHWTLVFLLQNPGWSGAAHVVDHRSSGAVVMIPELGWETVLPGSPGLVKNQILQVQCVEVKLPYLEALFRILI